MSLRNGLIWGGVLVAVIGIVIGAIYPLVMSHVSGALVGHYPMRQLVTDWKFPDGTPSSYPGSKTYRPAEIELDPSMNPLMFNWEGTIDPVPGRSTGKSEFVTVSVYQGRTRYYRDSFSLSLRQPDQNDRHGPKTSRYGSKTSQGSLESFSVQQPGKYHLVVEQSAHSGHSVSGIGITVRRNVSETNLALLPAGFGMTIVGGLLAVAAARYLRNEPEQPPDA